MKIETLLPFTTLRNSQELLQVSSNLSTQSSLTSQEDFSSRFQVFFEDLTGYIRNLFLWPILGHQIMMYQLFFALFLPVLLPYILIAEFFRVLIDFFSCGCIAASFLKEKFSLRAPNSTEKAAFLPLIEQQGSKHLTEDQQVRLLHVINHYLNHCDNYDSSPHGKKNERFQALIKVQVDRQTVLFRYCPHAPKEQILEEYLQFVALHATSSSTIKHCFIGLDYTYFIGLLHIKIKTDIVDFPLRDEEEPFSICGPILRWFSIGMGKHTSEKSLNDNHFALWPGFTRRAICDLINRKLKGPNLQDHQISLIDLENLVRI